MSTLSLRLPQSINQNAKLYAQREGVSVNQLAATALAEKLAALAAEDYIAQRGQRLPDHRRQESGKRLPGQETTLPVAAKPDTEQGQSQQQAGN